MSTVTSESTTYDAIVIGAGFSGMYLIRKLRDELGLDVRVFERGDDVGGTWYWNRYPGARCDVESMFYSYSFDADLQREWEWTEKYPAQPELLAYANHVADRFDLRRSIEFETEIVAAEFDDDEGTWTVTTARGTRATAQFLITGVGCLSTPSTPKFEGIDLFEGSIYHTGSWPHEGVDFSGQRVAVIGTGSSGIQSIPMIAQQAADLTVFQRTATFAVPARNRPLTNVEQTATKQLYRELREAARHSPGGVLAEPSLGAGAEIDPRTGRIELERRWWLSGLNFAGAFNDTMVSAETNEIVSEFVREKIRGTVEDPDTARLLEPRDYPIGTKRLIIDTDYYATYNRPNVHLVSIRDTPISAFTAKGVRVGDHEYEFDSVVLATGYDAMTGSLLRFPIRGSGGVLLSEAWSEGPKSYLGLAVHGFPNLFTVTGPGSPSVISNMIVSIEQHVEWISDYIAHLREEGIDRTEATDDAQEAWVATCRQIAAHTLYPQAASWYMGANIPGKPRVFMPYIGGVGVYRAQCDRVAQRGYEGFTHVSARSLAGAESTR